MKIFRQTAAAHSLAWRSDRPAGAVGVHLSGGKYMYRMYYYQSNEKKVYTWNCMLELLLLLLLILCKRLRDRGANVLQWIWWFSEDSGEVWVRWRWKRCGYCSYLQMSCFVGEKRHIWMLYYDWISAMSVTAGITPNSIIVVTFFLPRPTVVGWRTIWEYHWEYFQLYTFWHLDVLFHYIQVTIFVSKAIFLIIRQRVPNSDSVSPKNPS